ncbi:MAG: GNAT family N-acetyltransferase [Tatlockia sp.]|nr:GNAT family N-acetyltransferase [Tatlockia sp.]
MNIFLETKNLIIRTPQLSDFDNLLALQTDADVMKYIGQGVRTKLEVMGGLEAAIAHQETHGFSLGSVFEKESELFVGRAGLIYLAYDDTQPEIEVGYALIKTAWGEGYGVELAKALINWGFQHLTVSKLVAVINPENNFSRRVLEKVNMNYKESRIYRGNEVAFYFIEKSSWINTKNEN